MWFVTLPLTAGYICSTRCTNFKFSRNINRVLHIYLVSSSRDFLAESSIGNEKKILIKTEGKAKKYV